MYRKPVAISACSRYTAGPQIIRSAFDAREPRLHVAPEYLRAVRQGGIVVRFAMLGSMAYVLAEIPKSGSSGTRHGATVRTPPLGLRRGRRADVRRGGPAARHSCRACVPRPGRRPPSTTSRPARRRWSPASSRSSRTWTSARLGSSSRASSRPASRSRRGASPSFHPSAWRPVRSRRKPGGWLRTS